MYVPTKRQTSVGAYDIGYLHNYGYSIHYKIYNIGENAFAGFSKITIVAKFFSIGPLFSK